MQGIVLYADGGVRPNPGFAGSGIHGYVYDTDVSVKGIGLGSTVASSQGYVPKDDTFALSSPKPAKGKKGKVEEEVVEEVRMTQVKQETVALLGNASNGEGRDTFLTCVLSPALVMPIKYVDMAVPIDFTTTNNLAELNAVLRSVEFILHAKKDHPDLRVAVINSDSELTVRGCNEWLDNWKKNNFVKSDGTMVANYKWWDALHGLKQQMEAADIAFSINWVRGHNGDFGNEKADMMATMAVYRAYRRQHDPVVYISPVEGYWKYDSELHPMIQHKCLYFNTGPDYHRSGIYNMGNHGKDDDLLGNRQSDGSYSHVRLNTPETILEQVVGFAKNSCKESDNLWVGYITRLAMPATREAVTINGSDSFDPMSEPHVGFRGVGSGRDPLLRMLRPPHLAHRAVSEVTLLSSVLDDFLSKKDDLVVRDVTSEIFEYEDVEKKGVITRKCSIKSSLPVGMPSLKLPVDYKLQGETEVKTRDLTFTSGIDILTRNALKRLESLNPCVYVVTWSPSAQTFRYATIVKTDDGIGIWGGVYSNLFVVPKDKKK